MWYPFFPSTMVFPGIKLRSTGLTAIPTEPSCQPLSVLFGLGWNPGLLIYEASTLQLSPQPNTPTESSFCCFSLTFNQLSHKKEAAEAPRVNGTLESLGLNGPGILHPSRFCFLSPHMWDVHLSYFALLCPPEDILSLLLLGSPSPAHQHEAPPTFCRVTGSTDQISSRLCGQERP